MSFDLGYTIHLVHFLLDGAVPQVVAQLVNLISIKVHLPGPSSMPHQWHAPKNCPRVSKCVSIVGVWTTISTQ